MTISRQNTINNKYKRIRTNESNWLSYLVKFDKIQKYLLICDKKVDLVEKNNHQYQKKKDELIKIVAYDLNKIKRVT